MNNSDSHIDKKARLSMSEENNNNHNQETFANVGDQAQSVDNTVRQTGAADAEGHPVQEVESLCMNCHKNGTTRLLLTRIPYFREVIIMSFECPHCGFKNSEIQPAAQVAEKGARYILKVEDKKDFNRQVVKSETATVKFNELDIEIPPKRGQLINIEGILQDMIIDLEADQEERKKLQPELYQKIQEVIDKINSYINAEPGTLPLTVSIDDPAGNSWIEYVPGEPAHKWAMYEYNRTAEQNVFLGLISADDVAKHKQEEIENKKQATVANVSSSLNKKEEPSTVVGLSDATEIENLENEVQTFDATCSACYKPCSTHMKSVNIPHFKEVIIMSTVCDHCGYKSNEVKTGGEIPAKGKRIVLKITDPEDLARDILKSETCGLNIPELNLDLTPGTLGGRFTTIEGLLNQVSTELHTRVFTQTSDSMDEETKTRWVTFFAKLQDAIDGKIGFTIDMVDPLAASYIQNVYAPDNDPNMIIEEFDRTFDQNEGLGLNDIKTD
ncbi:Zpr1 protein with putative zinc finger [Candida orthopsilosis Co 90-125]|uniref:Zpr1 protein with putative zinc finger n=1 Tax=Candida orthopsilosis (strain 90-125) TaxID=1136231 RepID=H8X273_CANO9|nr:Zpr1 protein with putative zinc finger [Candida orthopsilosis Co 90-125]CCG22795.1 Zpr1 protein with putative zinc finger [Candida orthopsilosis Co 90-125]